MQQVAWTWPRLTPLPHLSEPNCEDVPGKLTGLPRARNLGPSPELRGGLKRNWPDHLSRGIWEPRVPRMDQANLARVPRAHHL